MNFDKALFKRDEKFIDGFVSVWNTLDNKAAVLSYEIKFIEGIEKELQIFKLSFQQSEADVNYSRTIFQTKIDTCRFAKGVTTSIFTRILTKNVVTNFAYTCPFPKNFIVKVTNLTITDTLFPRLLNEVKFKLDYKFQIVPKNHKRYLSTHNLTIFGRYKKLI